MYPRVGEKRSIDDINLEDEEAIGSLCRLSGRAVSPKSAMEHEKRIRREIANSNERRRMQSINAGFASLKSLLPHQEGEKLSKAAILQQTAEYIYQLEQEKTRLLAQNCQLKRLLNQQHHSDNESSPTGGDSPNEDRSISTVSPPLNNSTSTSSPLSTPLPPLPPSSGNVIVETEEGRRAPRVIKNDELVHGPIIEPVEIIENRKVVHQQVKFDYATIKGQPGIKVEIRQHNLEEEEEELQQLQLEPMPTGVTTTTATGALIEEAQLNTMEVVDVQDIRLAKPVIREDDTAPSIQSRVPISVLAPANGTNLVSAGTAFRSVPAKQNSGPAAAFLTSPTTILTVLPSNKAKTLTPLLDLRTLGEIGTENAEGKPPGTTTVEYVNDANTEGFRNHTFYIVNSNNSSCQKSLDTICEAIRHLEGDHMFPPEDTSVTGVVAPPIKEEVVTTEWSEEERTTLQPMRPQEPRKTTHPAAILTTDFESPVLGHHVGVDRHPEPVGDPHLGCHPGSVGHVTLHMLPSDPQEVPLELTTTHRSSSNNSSSSTAINHIISTNSMSTSNSSELVHYSSKEVACSGSQQRSHPNTTLLHSRPGVIVVKNQ